MHHGFYRNLGTKKVDRCDQVKCLVNQDGQKLKCTWLDGCPKPTWAHEKTSHHIQEQSQGIDCDQTVLSFQIKVQCFKSTVSQFAKTVSFCILGVQIKFSGATPSMHQNLPKLLDYLPEFTKPSGVPTLGTPLSIMAGESCYRLQNLRCLFF
jgi:hypothetical protein